MNRQRWTIAAMLCVIVGVVMMLPRSFDRPAAERPVASLPVVSMPALPSSQASAPSAEAARGKTGSEEIEVCGVGFIPLEDPSGAIASSGQPSRELMARFDAALRSSGSASARALGLLMEGVDLADRATEAVQLQSRLQLCGADSSCSDPLWRELWRTRREAASASTDALAREAASSTDPAVYAMAVQACSANDTGGAGPGNCQLTTLQRWVQLDPDNAVPWTHLAADAVARKDAEAADEALYRAGIASASRLYGDSLLAVAAPVLSSQLTLAERREVALKILVAQAAWHLPAYRTPMQMCSEDALSDSNRRQICDAYATALVDKGRTLIERSIGIRMGVGLGWPTARIQALRDERKAMAMAQEDTTELQRSCAGVEKWIDRAIDNAALGEIEQGKAAIVASGKSIDDWMRLARERDEAASSASSASAAASAAPRP